ncbi:MAG: bacterial transcriptional activator domain-containing protein [Phycisphaerales bacterium]|nr:MAG: bacterial transcriptional activator domain-containing protein [Phycisphaerales bacterium]
MAATPSDSDPIFARKTTGPSRWCSPAWRISAAALCLASVLWAGSRVRAAGDTWIALAAGRLICERGYFDFPLKDEFSFTFQGEVWTNQNWLSHVIYWWVYDHLCPSALVGLKLALIALVGLATWRSAWLLSGSQPASLLCACVALLFAAPFFDIRPNSLGLVCLASLYWILISLKYRRGWVAWLALPLLTFWGNAHGSFMFGYALIFLFLCTEAGQRALGRRVILTPTRRLAVLLLATVISAAFVAISSPYGLSNFTHPFTIMTGPDRDIFQAIVEWRPPHALFALLPQATAFWVLVGISAVLWIGAALRDRRTQSESPQNEWAGHPVLFDATEIILVTTGLYLGLKHLRFAPYFVLLSLPVTAKMLSSLLGSRTLPAHARATSRGALSTRLLVALTCINVAVAAYFGGARATDLRQAYTPASAEPYTTRLFHRHILHEADPAALVEFAARCGLSGPIYNEWSWGGYVIFHAPQFKVFIDGRAQSLYSAAHCEQYFRLKNDPSRDHEPRVTRGREIDARFARLGIDLVLAPHNPEWASRIVAPLLETAYWHPVIQDERGILLVNGLSSHPATIEFMRSYWAGKLDWPDTWQGWWIRGHAWHNAPEPDCARAVEAYRKAVALGPPQAWLYKRLAECYRRTGHIDEALRYFQQERRRLATMTEPIASDKERVIQCIEVVDRALQLLERPNQ